MLLPWTVLAWMDEGVDEPAFVYQRIRRRWWLFTQYAADKTIAHVLSDDLDGGGREDVVAMYE